jgi:hypothetical protein
MALVTRSTAASIDTSTAMNAPQISGNLYAGEALDVAAPCYIKTSDGKVYMSNGTSANEAAEVVGFTPRAVKVDEPVTLFGIGARFKYGSSLTVGDVLYLAATAGRLDTAATTGDAFGYAQVVSTTDIVVIRGMPVLTSATVGAGTIGTTELAASGVTEAKIAPNTLTGLVAGNVANANVIGGVPVLHRVDITAGALGNTDVTLTHKTRVVDVWLVLRGAGVASTTLQVKNGATAITDAMAASGSDTAVVRCATLNDAAWEIAGGGTLRVTSATGATQPEATVFVLGIRVA